MYWTDLGNATIQRANLDGTFPETLPIAGLSGPVIIRLDVPAGKMYWTDEGNDTIKRANLNGSSVQTLVSTGLSSPEGLSLDLVNRKMYWTDRGLNVIKRANLDGTGVQTVIGSGLSAPQGIDIDPDNGRIYWAEIQFTAGDKVRRAFTDGSGIQTLFGSAGLAPIAVALDLTSADCNGNGIPDDCDLTGSLSTPSYFTNVNIAIPDCPAGGGANPSLSSSMGIQTSGTITDLDVLLDITHNWIGDLLVTLTHENTGTTVALLSRMGLAENGAYCTDGECCGCGLGDLFVLLDDESAADIETACPLNLVPPIYRPNPGGSGLPGVLSAFDNEDMAGTWTLEVFDAADGEGYVGTLLAWELDFTVRGTPTEQDCNFNGSPDSCDIASGLSADLGTCVGGPMNGLPCSGLAVCFPGTCVGIDGIPDKCQGFTGLCNIPEQQELWTCFTHWEPPTDYADDDGHLVGIHVKLPAPYNLLLDDTVKVPSLHVMSGATLRVTKEGPVGDLQFSPPGVLFVEGRLLVAGNRKIGEPNDLVGTVDPDPFIVAAGGVFGTVDPEPHAPPVTATLYARDLVILTGAAPLSGGKVELSSHISAIISRNLTLTGADDPEPHLPGGVAGITPPPKLRLSQQSTMAVAANITLEGSPEVKIVSNAPDAVSLGGNFDNQAITPSSFDWSEGSLTMTGPDPQVFEVAGLDLGDTDEGFWTDVDGLFDPLPHSNFSMGSLQIGLDAPPTAGQVTFVNRSVNTRGTDPCDEALYVRKLIVKPGSTVRMENCRVYYGILEGSAAATVVGPCGPLVQVDLPAKPIADPNNKTRTLSLSVPASPPAVGQTALRVRLIDLQNPQPPNLPQNPPPDFSPYEFTTCSAPGEVGTGNCARWVGKPGIFLESQDSPGSGNYKAARLQCTPLYRNWTPEGLIHVVGAEIAPSSTYDVENFAARCAGNEVLCGAVSDARIMTTRRSGDVEEPFNPPSTTDQPDVTDIAQLVNKWKNVAGAPVKAISQLQPNLPDMNVDINALDIVAVVDAVRERAYAFSGPCPCPSEVTCGPGPGSVPCTSPTLCVAAFGPGATCVKTCVGGANDGEPCINDTHCPGGTCGAGFCRDRCGRCTP